MHVEVDQVAVGGWLITLRFVTDRSSVQLLRPSTFTTGLSADRPYFEFSPNLRYRGRLVKRLPYGVADLVTVSAGTVLTSQPIDLATMYRVPESSAGLRVRYRARQPLNGAIDSLPSTWTVVESEWLDLR